jgi:hypothetical protein
MSVVEVRDYVLSLKHIHGDPSLRDELLAQQAGALITLEVDGVTWVKMESGNNGTPAPGLEALGPARDHWRSGSLLKPSVVHAVCVLVALILLFSSQGAFAFSETIGKGYCQLRHPVESLTSKRVSCESQHIVQQQSGGDDVANTIWINTTLHDYHDRSTCKPWEEERPAFSLFPTKDMERAYMIGVWANGYYFFVYDYHGIWTSTLTEWDGAAHILYMITAIVDFPQKEFGYMAYQVELLRKGGDRTQFIDAGIGIFIDAVEVAFGIAYSLVGIVTGTVLHPIETLRDIPSLAILTISASFDAVWFLLKGFAALFSFGYVGSCGL